MPEETHEVACHWCRQVFDAVQAAWCTCLAAERTLVCPSCHACFCKAPPFYKQAFWMGAPGVLWDRKFEEHHQRWPEPEQEPLARPLVLLVDDEADVRRVGAAVIGSLGFGVIVGTNGAEGLELARKYKPDLVLSDALMPGMDGREMCRRIKAEPETARAKVVVMTGFYVGTKHTLEAFQHFEVDDYLSKPLNPRELQDLLHRHLATP